MNILIRTGFEKISHGISFQPETTKKGKQLVKAKHVINVEEVRENRGENGYSCRIQARVIRQTSVTSSPYRVMLNIDANRKVTTVSCDCVYNKSGKCKHIAAVIEYINNEESFSKADREQEWGKPTAHQLAKEKYSKGKYFFEMFPGPTKPDVAHYGCELSELEGPSALKSVMIESAKDNSYYSIQAVMASILNTVEINIEKQDCEACLEFFFIFNEEYSVYQSNYVLQNNILKNYYDNFIVLSRDEIVKLCCETLIQSKCKKWYSIRRVRISASQNVHAIKCRRRKNIESLVNDMLYAEKVDVASTRYGTKHESAAKTEYQNLYGVEVKQVGVIISHSQPWLCASLDGVVIYDGCIKKLVEFKCPSSCEKIPVVDCDKKICNVKYLQFKNEQIELKESDRYYTQVQVQMYVTGLSICDLFVYSPIENGSCLISIHRNEIFLKNIIPLCEQFYFQHYLPAITASLTKENCDENANIVEQDRQQPERHFTGAIQFLSCNSEVSLLKKWVCTYTHVLYGHKKK